MSQCSITVYYTYEDSQTVMSCLWTFLDCTNVTCTFNLCDFLVHLSRSLQVLFSSLKDMSYRMLWLDCHWCTLVMAFFLSLFLASLYYDDLDKKQKQNRRLVKEQIILILSQKRMHGSDGSNCKSLLLSYGTGLVSQIRCPPNMGCFAMQPRFF